MSRNAPHETRIGHSHRDHGSVRDLQPHALVFLEALPFARSLLLGTLRGVRPLFAASPQPDSPVGRAGGKETGGADRY